MPQTGPIREIKIGEIAVPRLGFGAMRITGRGIWGPPPDRAAAIRLLQHAVQAGVRLIDTADSYGPFVSEELIAEALAPYPAGLLIATKGGLERGGPDDWRSNGDPKHLREACEASLRRLRLSRIDLYQLHREDPRFPIEESIGALKELQSAGKIRYIGVCNVSLDQLRRVRSIAPVLSVQNRYNIEDRHSEDVLRACTSEGTAFIPWHPLGGLESMPRHIVDAIRPIAQRHGASFNQLLLAWLLHKSPITAPIPGTASIAHFDENMGSTNISLSASDLAELDKLAG
ncbi:MAG TPA: aldo/keto reductase [Candidatus Binatia bacterium]|nr:aldo/keto reductase [Candidatus Binatia bacterium]